MAEAIPTVPVGRATAFLLSGEYQMDGFRAKLTETLPRFRDTPVLAQAELQEAQLAHLVRLLQSADSYGDEAMRCFIPRHGLKFSAHGRELDALLCFECFWLYCWADGRKTFHRLSARGVKELRDFYWAIFPEYAGMDDREVARQLMKKEPNKTLEPTPMSVTSPATQEPRQP